VTDERDFDVTLLGATGFAGGLIADYLAANAPASTRLAIAGRSPAKLDEVRARFGRDVEAVTVDVDKEAAVRPLAERTRVLITTVGPYIRFGEPVVAACAASGTDYLDLTGEPEFTDLMYLQHHERAVETGARLVHSCGFDSMPHDLGAQFTVEQLAEGVPITVRGYVRARGTFSGGTAASALEIMGRYRQGKAVHDVRAKVEPEPEGRRVRVATGRIGFDRDIGAWVVPMPSIDPLVVAESARQLPRYGPDFTYSHYWAGNSPFAAVGVVAGAAALFGAAQLPSARRAIARLRPSGSGPTPEQRERAWFKVCFIGEADGTRVLTEVAGGDPGYTETATMISEAALCLAHDDLPDTAGQVTTASAMGAVLRARLERAGITFTVAP
jgi:short subunit dehydrogenase-like uncharacterized protein